LASGERCQLSVALHLTRARVAALFYSLVESAKLCRVEPRAYLREATLRAVRNPGTGMLARELKLTGPEREVGQQGHRYR
jgi:hypothetical protein